MARLARVVVPGLPHHIVQRGNRRQDVFFSDKDKNIYLEFLRKACEEYDVKIWSWCLMTNHVHFIAVPEKEDSLARCFSDAHVRYTRMINFRKKWRGHLWQGRFSSSPLGERYLIAASRYVERNPVRARLIRIPWEYEYSSAAYYAGERNFDPLVRDDAVLKELVSDWRELLRISDDQKDLDRIHREEAGGRPIGDEYFIRETDKRTKRVLQRRIPGRPRGYKPVADPVAVPVPLRGTGTFTGEFCERW